MATTAKKTAPGPDEPFAEGGLVGVGAPVVLGAGEEVVLVGSPSELVSDAPAPVEVVEGPLPGGTYINTGGVDLVLLQPPKVLKPGRVIELEFGLRHRDLRPATDAEIKAAQQAETAEQTAAQDAAAETGQEQ